MSLGHSDYFSSYATNSYVTRALPSYYNAYAAETGSTWYQANSDTKTMSNVRCDGDSNRWRAIGGSSWNDLGYEVVVYLKPERSTMSSDGHIGLKHWGPYHTPPCDTTKDGKCCCWYDTGIREGGDVVGQIEYPHPTNITKWREGNIGRHIDNGSMLGVRWSIRKTSGYHNRRLRMWVDTSGGRNFKWRKMYDRTDTGQIMPHWYGAPSTQHMEIRISDIPCSKIHMQWGPQMRKMV